MKEKEDSIEFLVRSLVKTGDLPLEQKVIDHVMEQAPPDELPKTIKDRTIAKLEKRQREMADAEERLRNPQKLNSLGELLSLLRKKRESATEDLAKQAGVPLDKLALLEDDAVSPLDFPLDEMARLIRFLGLRLEVATELIKRSYQLFKLKPDLTEASARYDSRLGTPESKVDAMSRALKELLLKSAKRKAQGIPDPEIEDYLKRLEGKL